MTLVIKTIGNNDYLYDYTPINGKTKATYLGRINDPHTEQRVREFGEKKRGNTRGDEKGYQILTKRIRFEYPGVKMFISEKFDGTLELDYIVIPEDMKGNGIGTKIMTEVVNYADRNDQTVVLTASSEYGSNKKRLIGFYKRFGFIENKGRKRDSSLSGNMYRIPKES